MAWRWAELHSILLFYGVEHILGQLRIWLLLLFKDLKIIINASFDVLNIVCKKSVVFFLSPFIRVDGYKIISFNLKEESITSVVFSHVHA